MLPILVGIILIQKKTNSIIKFLLLNFFISLSGIIILLSGERSALFLFILFCFILLFLYKIQFQFKIFLFLFNIIQIILIISLNQPVKDRIVSQTFNTVTSELKLSDAVTSQYRYHFKSAIEMFADKKITGHGPKMYRIICKDDKYFIHKYSCQTHPHNIYIQLLAETGLVGFLFVILGFLYFGYLLIKDFTSYYAKNLVVLANYNLMFISALFINLWPFVTSGNFFNNWICFVFYFPLIFFINYFINKS